jgi:organic hydroperoxide reductase OsmC/OhrA
MSEHVAEIKWEKEIHSNDASTYSRNHVARFEGQQKLNISAAVEYKGDALCADPEQLLVTAAASCHMLFFLAIADQQGFLPESYSDTPVGYLEKTENGGLEITLIELYPKIVFSGEKKPDDAAIARMHAGAHKRCFVGNSIKAKITVGTDS